jgi:hypothetical protein
LKLHVLHFKLPTTLTSSPPVNINEPQPRLSKGSAPFHFIPSVPNFIPLYLTIKLCHLFKVFLRTSFSHTLTHYFISILFALHRLAFTLVPAHTYILVALSFVYAALPINFHLSKRQSNFAIFYKACLLLLVT